MVENGKKFVLTEDCIRTTPYSENNYLLGFKSPYYNESHYKMQTFLRKWFYDNLKTEAESYEESGKVPSNETWLKMGQVGLLASKLGPGRHLEMICKNLNITLPGGIDPTDFN